MGVRKHGLSIDRKNGGRKKYMKLILSIPRRLVSLPPLQVSLPITSYAGCQVSTLAVLQSRLALLKLPDGWVNSSQLSISYPSTSQATQTCLAICKLRLEHQR